MASTTNGLVDFSQPSLLISAASILFNPLFWNIVARQEYNHKTLTRLSGNRPQAACYCLAATIFLLGLVRDFLFHRALTQQPALPLLLESGVARAVAMAMIAAGNVLVVSSTWVLGITGTFLGDYFGILNEGGMATGFPFSVTSAPMYYGSTISFLGGALMMASPAGVMLAAEVLVVYLVALRYEDEFTREIYARRDRERATVAGGKKAN